ncbi:MAG: cupredoxin domain-containing protein [Spirochaetia bacterium]
MNTTLRKTDSYTSKKLIIASVAGLLLIFTPFVLSAQEADVTVEVEGENYVFIVDGEENPDIVVEEGDTVRIELEVTQGFHDWVVDEFDAATKQVGAGSTTTVEFEADQTGEFYYYCSVAGHRAQGMEGTLIVE